MIKTIQRSGDNTPIIGEDTGTTNIVTDFDYDDNNNQIETKLYRDGLELTTTDLQLSFVLVHSEQLTLKIIPLLFTTLGFGNKG